METGKKEKEDAADKIQRILFLTAIINFLNALAGLIRSLV